MYGVSLCIGFLKADIVHFVNQIYLFNKFWLEGYFPANWNIATVHVLPLVKPNKVSYTLDSYRLIIFISILFIVHFNTS